MKDLEFIKEFQKIQLKPITKSCGVSSSNLYTGKCSDIKIKKVKNKICKEFFTLYTKSLGVDDD